MLGLLVDSLNGPLLASFVSLAGNRSTMEEKAHDDHSGPQRA